MGSGGGTCATNSAGDVNKRSGVVVASRVNEISGEIVAVAVATPAASIMPPATNKCARFFMYSSLWLVLDKRPRVPPPGDLVTRAPLPADHDPEDDDESTRD